MTANTALFIRHDGYIGALGAFFGDEDPQSARPRMLGPGSLQENFARERRISEHAVGAVGVLDAVRDRMVEFPLLLAPHEYQPDTIVILDAEQRDFWLTALDSSLSGLVKAVAHSMAKSDADVTARLNEFTAYGRPYAS